MNCDLDSEFEFQWHGPSSICDLRLDGKSPRPRPRPHSRPRRLQRCDLLRIRLLRPREGVFATAADLPLTRKYYEGCA